MSSYCSRSVASGEEEGSSSAVSLSLPLSPESLVAMLDSSSPESEATSWGSTLMTSANVHDVPLVLRATPRPWWCASQAVAHHHAGQRAPGHHCVCLFERPRQRNHKNVACPRGERKTSHPGGECHPWQYLIGHTTAPLSLATQDSTDTQNCPKHSHKQIDGTSMEVEGHWVEMDSLYDDYHHPDKPRCDLFCPTSVVPPRPLYKSTTIRCSRRTLWWFVTQSWRTSTMAGGGKCSPARRQFCVSRGELQMSSKCHDHAGRSWHVRPRHAQHRTWEYPSL